MAVGIKLTNIVVRANLPKHIKTPPTWFWFMNQWNMRPEASVHLVALRNGYQGRMIYEQYLKESNQKDHSSEKFADLLNSFDPNKMDPIEINLIEDLHVVTDGCHRLAILIYKGIIKDELPEKFYKVRRVCSLGEWFRLPETDS